VFRLENVMFRFLQFAVAVALLSGVLAPLRGQVTGGRISGIAAFAAPDSAAHHKSLLPRPQQVTYGSGRLALRGLTIRFASAPSPEDRFAARQLASALSIPIGEGAAPAKAILLHRTGAVDALPVPGERTGPDSREAYLLKVGSEGIEIRARSSAGVYYGTQTLRQLIEGEGAQAGFPVVEIHDWPALAYRGTLVDTGSEAPQPTEAEIERHLDFLSRWKANQYYFYSEVGIELDGYPLLGPDTRYSKEQVRRIIAYGRERHIDVVPSLELFGHQHDLFRVETYSELADFPHGVEFSSANPKAMALVADWADQYARLFPSPFVHIGFDETYQIEMAAKEQSMTTSALFLKQLTQVSGLFQQRGKHVMIAGDMVATVPEVAAKLPPGIIVTAWCYNLSDPTYKKWMEPLVANNLPIFVMSGVVSWFQIAPDFDTSFANIDTWIVAAQKSRALGMINTTWGDDLQMLLRMSWPGMAYGAAAPWQSVAMDRAGFFSDYSLLIYPRAVAPDVSEALAILTNAETAFQKILGDPRTQQAMWQDPLKSSALKRSELHREDLRQVRLSAEEAQVHLYRALSHGGDPATLSSLLVGARVLDYAAMKFLFTAEIGEAWQKAGQHPTKAQLTQYLGYGIYNHLQSRIADLMEYNAEIRKLYRKEWLAEYTPYRLNSAMAIWRSEFEYWRHLKEWFYSYMGNFREGDVLPPLTEAIRQAK
jgi:hexosaminidase